MSFELTRLARLKSEASNITPNLVLTIDGVTTQYGAITIKKYIRVGDPGLVIGTSWVIGGLAPIADQQTLISFDGTTTNISQKLDPDKASGASVSQMAIALVDIDGAALELVSPGFKVTDILGRKAVVSLGFSETAWPDDYIKIFRGVIDSVDIGPGKVTLQLSHPDQKKRQEIFIKASTALTGGIGAGDVSILADSVSGFLTRILGPDGAYDSSISYGLRIDDEIIFYTGISGTTFTGCARGQLFTTAASHSAGATVDSFIRLQGNAMDLALKIMLSGLGYWVTGVDITHFGQLGDGTPITDGIFFNGINVFDEYGVTIGDYVTTTGATNGGNNQTLKVVTDVQTTEDGSYIVVDGAGFIAEPDSPATLSFRSRYDTLAVGASLGLSADQVDVKEHERLKRLFLSNFNLDFYLKDTADGKEFIEQEIYFPAAAYSIPRKGQVSLGYHIGPLPNNEVKIFDQENIQRPSQITLKRALTKNFYNTIVYRFEELPLEEKFIRGYIAQDGTSLVDIPVGTRALVISSKGMRDSLSGLNLAQTAGNRRLKRYKRGAEFVNSMEVFYGDSYNVEIGDIIVLQTSSVKMADTRTNTRTGDPRLYEVQNKTFDLKTGKVKLDLVDTNYTTNSRYCLMSPSSRIESVTSASKFKVYAWTNSQFGINEGRKWSRYLGATVKVYNTDYSNFSTSTIQSVSGNTITLSPALSFTPAAEDTMSLYNYDSGDATLHLIYGWMRNLDPFSDGTKRYEMLG